MVFVISEGKIFLFIFAEIHGPGLGRNPLEGVIAEFAAVFAHRHNSLLGAEHHLLVHFRAIAAVQAGALHLFPEQHSDPFLSGHIIHHLSGNFHCFFQKKHHRGEGKCDPAEPQKAQGKGGGQQSVGELLEDA